VRKITIIAHPNSRKPRIEVDLLGTLHVYVGTPPLDGKANEAVIEALAKYLGIAKSLLSIASGERSKRKVVEIRG